MPSLTHQTLVELFRERPALAPTLLDEVLHVPLPVHATVAVVEAAFDQLVPTEFRADLVLELQDSAGAIVLEVQLRIKPVNRRVWPVYVAALHARKGCAVALIVVAPDRRVAAWAAKPIVYGAGASALLRPLVLGAKEFPPITDPEAVRAAPERAVLAAIAHADTPEGLAVAQVTLSNLDGLDPEHAAAYVQLIHDALDPAARAALEQWIMETQRINAPLPWYLQPFEDRGRAAGKAEGKAAAIRPILHLFEQRLARTLTDDERATLMQRLDTLGGDRLGDVVLDLSATELAAWLAAPAAR